MGYASTTMIFYGVDVTPEQSKLIYENNIDPDNGNIKHETQDTITDEVSYIHRGKTIYNHRDIPELRSDGTDGRIHNLSYDEGFDRHILGINMASKGYACDDRIEEYLIPSNRAKSNYIKYIQPILDLYNIELLPSIKIITQVH